MTGTERQEQQRTTARHPVGGHALVGGLWTTGGQIAPYLYTVVVSVVAGRILGPGPMGRQSFIAFVVLATTTVCAAGLPQSLMRASAEAIGRGSPGSVPGLARWGWRVTGVGATFGTIAILVIAALGATPRAAWLFAAAAVAVGILHKVPGSILAGTQHWRLNSLGILVSGALGTVATIVVLALGGGISGMLAVAAASTLVLTIWATIYTKRVLAPMRTEDATGLEELRSRASRFGLAASVSVILSFVVGQRSELFFLDRSSSNAQIAFYTIAFSAVTMLQTLPVGMTNVVSPTFAQFFGAGQLDRIRSGFSRGLRLVLLVSAPIAAGGLVLGPPLIRLAYGDRYAHAGTVFRILVVSVPLAPLGAICGGLLVGYGRMRFPIVVASVAAVADLAAAAVLVPRFDAIGAALANETAALTATTIQFVYCFRLLGGVEIRISQFARMLAASGLAAAAAQAVLELGSGAPPFLAAAALFVVVLAGLAISLRVLPRGDADWLASALRGTRIQRLGRVCMLLAHRPSPAASP